MRLKDVMTIKWNQGKGPYRSFAELYEAVQNYIQREIQSDSDSDDDDDYQDVPIEIHSDIDDDDIMDPPPPMSIFRNYYIGIWPYLYVKGANL
ncbi:unnamed protein product [Medioppia subpectinata]|uniref:Uncharacterized protein n=1 Tax=Medioppia subpectinata TaxID=1979941 RepID=A0A7R9KFU6_9ACAR|nr:unnamed protein product [Medioppia subpectinata]CAG2102442.1 unnamed protein product [Medioppia subpectinata]